MIKITDSALIEKGLRSAVVNKTDYISTSYTRVDEIRVGPTVVWPIYSYKLELISDGGIQRDTVPNKGDSYIIKVYSYRVESSLPDILEYAPNYTGLYDDWVHVYGPKNKTVESDGKITYEFDVTVDENDKTTSTRNTTFYIVNGHSPQIPISVRQAGADVSLSANTYSIEISATKDSSANVTITSTVNNKSTSWSASITSGDFFDITTTSNTLTITASKENTDTTPRTGYIKISNNYGSTYDKTITVTQRAGEIVLSADPASVTLANTSGSFKDVTVTSTVNGSFAPWTADANSSFFTYTDSGTSASDKLTITASENNIGNERTGLITLSNGYTTYNVSVAQAPGQVSYFLTAVSLSFYDKDDPSTTYPIPASGVTNGTFTISSYYTFADEYAYANVTTATYPSALIKVNGMDTSDCKNIVVSYTIEPNETTYDQTRTIVFMQEVYGGADNFGTVNFNQLAHEIPTEIAYIFYPVESTIKGHNKDEAYFTSTPSIPEDGGDTSFTMVSYWAEVQSTTIVNKHSCGFIYSDTSANDLEVSITPGDDYTYTVKATLGAYTGTSEDGRIESFKLKQNADSTKQYTTYVEQNGKVVPEYFLYVSKDVNANAESKSIEYDGVDAKNDSVIPPCIISYKKTTKSSGTVYDRVNYTYTMEYSSNTSQSFVTGGNMEDKTPDSMHYMYEQEFKIAENKETDDVRTCTIKVKQNEGTADECAIVVKQNARTLSYMWNVKDVIKSITASSSDSYNKTYDIVSKCIINGKEENFWQYTAVNCTKSDSSITATYKIEPDDNKQITSRQSISIGFNNLPTGEYTITFKQCDTAGNELADDDYKYTINVIVSNVIFCFDDGTTEKTIEIPCVGFYYGGYGSYTLVGIKSSKDGDRKEPSMSGNTSFEQGGSKGPAKLDMGPADSYADAYVIIDNVGPNLSNTNHNETITISQSDNASTLKLTIKWNKCTTHEISVSPEDVILDYKRRSIGRTKITCYSGDEASNKYFVMPTYGRFINTEFAILTLAYDQNTEAICDIQASNENITNNKRNLGSISFNHPLNNSTATVQIYQNKNPYSIEAVFVDNDKTEKTIGYNIDSATIKVTSSTTALVKDPDNIPFLVSVQSQDNWVRVTTEPDEDGWYRKPNTQSDCVILLSCDTNRTAEDREATITITQHTSGKTCTLTLTQTGASYTFEVDPKECTVYNDDDYITFNIESYLGDENNQNYVEYSISNLVDTDSGTIILSADRNWCELEENKLTIIFSNSNSFTNYSFEPKDYTFTLTQSKSNNKRSFIITQAGATIQQCLDEFFPINDQSSISSKNGKFEEIDIDEGVDLFKNLYATRTCENVFNYEYDLDVTIYNTTGKTSLFNDISNRYAPLAIMSMLENGTYNTYKLLTGIDIEQITDSEGTPTYQIRHKLTDNIANLNNTPGTAKFIAILINMDDASSIPVKNSYSESEINDILSGDVAIFHSVYVNFVPSTSSHEPVVEYGLSYTLSDNTSVSSESHSIDLIVDSTRSVDDLTSDYGFSVSMEKQFLYGTVIRSIVDKTYYTIRINKNDSNSPRDVVVYIKQTGTTASNSSGDSSDSPMAKTITFKQSAPPSYKYTLETNGSDTYSNISENGATIEFDINSYKVQMSQQQEVGGGFVSGGVGTLSNNQSYGIATLADFDTKPGVTGPNQSEATLGIPVDVSISTEGSITVTKGDQAATGKIHITVKVNANSENSTKTHKVTFKQDESGEELIITFKQKAKPNQSSGESQPSRDTKISVDNTNFNIGIKLYHKQNGVEKEIKDMSYYPDSSTTISLSKNEYKTIKLPNFRYNSADQLVVELNWGNNVIMCSPYYMPQGAGWYLIAPKQVLPDDNDDITGSFTDSNAIRMRDLNDFNIKVATGTTIKNSSDNYNRSSINLIGPQRLSFNPTADSDDGLKLPGTAGYPYYHVFFAVNWRGSGELADLRGKALNVIQEDLPLLYNNECIATNEQNFIGLIFDFSGETIEYDDFNRW